MAISFSLCRKAPRYQVRICRHGVYYSKNFACSNFSSQGKALCAAEDYERKLIEILNTPPLKTSGRSKKDFENGPLFEPQINVNYKYNTKYVAVWYRREDGKWRSTSYSIRDHGLLVAIDKAVARAKELHVPNPNRVERRKMPSVSYIKNKLEKLRY